MSKQPHQSNNPYLNAGPSSGPTEPEPSDAPPAYAAATAPQHATSGPSNGLLEVPGANGGDNASLYSDDGSEDGEVVERRKSMENEMRDLPAGWVREVDPVSKHLFFVDITASPPRSIWHHPFDDPEFLAKLPDTDPHYAEFVQARASASASGSGSGHPGKGQGHHNDNGHGQPNAHVGGGSGRIDQSARDDGKLTFGRKLKNKLTGQTHEERVKQRAQQAALEQKQYEAYLARRQAMLDDPNRQTIYMAPSGARGRHGYNSGYGYGGRGYGGGGYGGYGGYGGGMGGMGMGGMGMGMGMMGAGMGGLLLGDMMF